MTAADVIRVMLELDQQCLTSRPSAWGKGAEIVRQLCILADCPGRRDLLGDWESIDISVAFRPATRELNQPTLDTIFKD